MAGDYERLMQGVYENYLHQKMPDADMCGVAEATEWFSFNDRLQRTVNQLQNYAIYPYLAYAFVMWHYLFATLAWPKINFPSKGYEHSQKLTSTKIILTGLRKGLSAHLKGIGEGAAVLIDTIPMLKRVINPSLRSVSLQLLSQKEKSDLTHTVEVMADFGLNYIQLKTPEGTYQYQLNPDLDQLCSFSGTGGQSSTYFGKQIVAREVELEQMRRAQPKLLEAGENGRSAARSSSSSKVSSSKALSNGGHKENTVPKETAGKGSRAASKSSPELPNHLRTLKPKQIVQKTKQVVSETPFRCITIQMSRTRWRLGIRPGAQSTRLRRRRRYFWRVFRKVQTKENAIKSITWFNLYGKDDWKLSAINLWSRFVSPMFPILCWYRFWRCLYNRSSTMKLKSSRLRNLVGGEGTFCFMGIIIV
uniref:Uncharacterized protein n=1 Tax=Anopheles maculatus TaxID=74869 RepID=A0A182SHQ7_9DIPT